MTHAQLIKTLEQRIAAEGSQTALASKLKVYPSVLSRVLAKRTDPPKQLLVALGLERVVTYQRVEERSSR